ncbi:MAG TPA: helix-turn-helix domain-containing protein [Mycobacteriales bacterium]|nr:helix-turn-helix domain-containing protein [Mycobacteriales bacterium]
MLTGRRLERDARREQLLRCATRLFGERPYAEVSTSDIAGEAGIARGLLNHYFGTKRDLYLEVVRRMVTVPTVDPSLLTGSLRRRVDDGVTWFLDAVAVHGATFAAVTGAGGIGADAEIEAILDAADDAAARRVLEVVGLDPDDERKRALIRAFGGLGKAAVREWQRGGVLDRDDVHKLLSRTLLTIVRDILPD